jgi:two-component system phosphate regulon sensor histidine kinase PhoR
MTLGLRSKLFLLAVGLSLAMLVPAGLYLEGRLRATMSDRIERELEADLRAARTLFDTARAATPEAADQLADRLGDDLGCRVTLIAPDGRVLGDSDVALAALASLDNHATRPEVVAALGTGTGSSRRRSSTTAHDMLYLAMPLELGEGAARGVVRVARPLDEIAAAMARLRWLLVIGGLLSLLASTVLSAVTVQLVSRTMRRAVENARAADTGGRPVRAPDLAIERAVAELAVERARFAAVLEGMAEGVIALDQDGAVTLINPAAQAMLGAGRDAVGRTFLEVVRVPALDELVARGRPEVTELELPATRRRVSARLAPQPGGRSVVVLHDVTALHRLEAVRRDFVANVSHELRTPVAVIRANAETLASGALDDGATAPRLVNAIERNAHRLTDLIDDLLDLSRLEAGSYRLELEAVAVEAAAQRALEAVDKLAERRRTQVSVAIDAALSASADPGALHQVLVNVLSNAIVHTPEGSRVVVTGVADGGHARVEVTDDGPGIPAAHRQRIFERFYRVDPGRSRDMGGTGLGLSIVKHLVDAMGGRVGVRDNEPRGAVVWIELAQSMTEK